MKIEYEGKKPVQEVLNEPSMFELVTNSDLKFNFENINQEIIHGDNYEVLKSMIQNGGMANKIDLIYIDPPFATNNSFHIGIDRTSTISSSKSDSIAYSDHLVGNDFIEFIRIRLILLRELLSSSGSIYLHLDSKMGHYIKVIMDEVFGQSNFRNEISRIKCNPKNFNRKAYGNIKDSIYFYSKGPAPIWNEPLVKKSQDEQDRLFNKTDNQGRRFTTNPLHAPGETASGDSGKPWHGVMPPAGRHWRNSHEVMDQLERDGLIHWSKNGVPRKIIYAENFSNKKLQDIWEFKDKPNPIYPTEKNLEMLKLIVSTSSNPDSIVLDAFAGSGSFGWAAHLLNRKWITIDESQKAIDTINKRFDEKPNSLLNGTAPRNWKLKKLIR